MLEIGSQLARAYRAPMLEELYSDAAHLGTGAYEMGDPTLENEIGHGVDTYIRLNPGPFFMEVAGFYNRVSGYIFLAPTGENDSISGFPVYQYRAETADFLGGELSAGMMLGAVTLKAGVDYVRATRLDTNAAVDSGRPLPGTPPLRTRAELRADFSNFWLGSTGRLTFAQTRTAPDEASTDGYALLAIDTGFRFDAAGLHVLTLRLDNALNATYRDHLSGIPGRDVPMAGRNLQMIYRWIY